MNLIIKIMIRVIKKREDKASASSRGNTNFL